MSPETKITFVLAGNYQQFAAWCSGKGLSPQDRSVRYLNEPYPLRGHRRPKVHRVGTWRERRNIQEFLDYLTFTEAEITDER